MLGRALLRPRAPPARPPAPPLACTSPLHRPWLPYSLLEHDLRSALAIHAEALVRQLDDGAHGLAHGVEGVDLVQLLLGHLSTHRLVVLLQVQHEAQQAALRLVAHLPGQGAVLLRGLQGEAGGLTGMATWALQGGGAVRGCAGLLPPAPALSGLCIPDSVWALG